MSLAVPSVYSIPMLLFVGWRGEPGKRDEPQHVVQGKATPGLLGKLVCNILLSFVFLFHKVGKGPFHQKNSNAEAAMFCISAMFCCLPLLA